MNKNKESNTVEEEVKDGGGASEATNSGSNKHQAQTDDDDDDDDDEDIPVYIESSPCSRWQKRRETVAQRDIPGIDASYLAMDTEEGVEVVWNEVLFSERKISDIQHRKVSEVFDKLIELNHMNIVKFHGYWQDRIKVDDRPRVVFITEFMSSGSLKAFLRKAKRTKQCLSKNSWRRWCIQLLSALNYLHSCKEPIVHGNLTCDTIFIQNTGLLKIGSIAPDVLHRHIKSISDPSAKNLHFQAPELDDESSQVTTAVDIYSLGMVTLEMINLDLGGNGDTHAVTKDMLNGAIDALENPVYKDMVLKCLKVNPIERPTARELLFHPALFDIPTLKLLSVHALADDIRSKSDRSFVSPFHHSISNDQTFAQCESTREGVKPIIFRYEDCPPFDLDKLLEDVQNGLYPITAYHLLFPTHSSLNVPARHSTADKILTTSPSFTSSPSMSIINADHDLLNQKETTTDTLNFLANNGHDLNSITATNNGIKARNNSNTIERFISTTSDSIELNVNELTSTIANSNTQTSVSLLNNDENEIRRILDIQCKLRAKDSGFCLLIISAKLQNRLQRDMTAEVDAEETPTNIAKELLQLGLIHEADYGLVEQSICKAFNARIMSPDIINGMSTSLFDVKNTVAVAATAALITAQNLQNQINFPSSTNGTLIDGNNSSL